MKNTLHPSGITISFAPSAHRYADSIGRGPYDSVTSIVKSLFPPFDADGSIAARVAAHHQAGQAAGGQRRRLHRALEL